MKRKLFALALALLLVLSLAACGGSKSAEFTAEAPAADMAYPMAPTEAEEYLGFDSGSTASGGGAGRWRWGGTWRRGPCRWGRWPEFPGMS